MANNIVKQEKSTQLAFHNLEKEKQQKVMIIKENIQLSHEGIMDYGVSVTKKLTDFSSEILSTMKVKDTPEVEVLITDLLGTLSQIDSDTLLKTKPSFFKKLFRVDEIKQFITKYDDVASVIGEVSNKLEKSQYQLKKDIELCSMYLEENMAYIEELDEYIMAGRLKVDEAKSDLEIEETRCDKEDMLDVHKISLKRGEIERLERKLHDLLLMRTIAVQNIPQLVLIRDGDAVLVEKIHSSINSAIPLWESQMVIAIQLLRQKGAIAIQKGVTDTTNRLIAQNSELLKTGSLEVAQELERGIIDLETLKKNSANLIDTLEGIKAIRMNGSKERERATQELAVLQSKLNEVVLLQ